MPWALTEHENGLQGKGGGSEFLLLREEGG